MRDDTPAVPAGPPTPSGTYRSTRRRSLNSSRRSNKPAFALNVDAIHSACDREFRDGRYPEGL